MAYEMSKIELDTVADLAWDRILEIREATTKMPLRSVAINEVCNDLGLPSTSKPLCLTYLNEKYGSQLSELEKSTRRLSLHR